MYCIVLHGIVLLALARGLYLARHLPTLYLLTNITVLHVSLPGAYSNRSNDNASTIVQASILVVVVEGGLLQGGRAEEGDEPPHQLHPGQITFIFNFIQHNLFQQPYLPNI